jgi:proline racemase
VPTIEGSAWITGFHQYLLDASDPFPEGYLVPDTFGGTALL